MKPGWLVVFAKAPRPGMVKTRLAPPLDLEQAAELYAAMLGDVLEVSGRWADRAGLEAVLAFHPPDAVAEMLRRCPPPFRLQAQSGPDLSARMANAFAEGASAGARFVLLRGSDSPALGPAHLDQAISALESGEDLVLTPDGSGGYALIAARRARSELFALPMSTTEVLSQTLDIANSLGLRVTLTDPTPDLDQVEDFACLDTLSAQETSDLCPRTVEAIADLRESGVR